MRARLAVERGLATPLVWELDADQTVSIGRDRRNTITFTEPTVSRFHAEIYAGAGGWLLRECVRANKPEPTNGTRLNGKRLQGPTPLQNNDEIAVGAARLRFSLDSSKEGTDAMTALGAPSAPATDSNVTALHADELTVLLQFMNDSLRQATPRGLIQLALSTVYNQTHAALAGFLSLDPDEPQLKLAHPAPAQVEPALSRQLTQDALRAQRSVWLAGRPSGEELGSLAGFCDAVCVPLWASPVVPLPNAKPPARQEAPLGALHVYKSSRPFTEREVQFAELLANALANNLRALRERRVMEADLDRLRERAATCGQALLGDSPVMERLRQRIARLADGPAIILITGESGVGKELIAQSLHELSSRRHEPLVCVNCATITDSLSEAQLFGHEEGAFTGATHSRPGYFQQADDGTLFLDEIGELSVECQAKLLRVLEYKKLRPVGGGPEVEVNVRVVAATNRDLRKEVERGRFRNDLFYRLVATVQAPPLREHAEDVPLLAVHFLEKFNAEYHRRLALSEAAMRKLEAFRWPGNVRQLRSVLETAVATVEGDVIHAHDLRLLHTEEAEALAAGPVSLNLEELTEWAVRRALAAAGGNNTKAAQLLGINRDTLINKLKKYGRGGAAP